MLAMIILFMTIFLLGTLVTYTLGYMIGKKTIEEIKENWKDVSSK